MNHEDIKNNIVVYYSYINSTSVSKNFYRYYNEMPDWRKKKADQYYFDKEKLQCVFSWALLNKALYDFYNKQIDCDIDFNKYKKPHLTKIPLYFNLSHSGSAVMCVISKDDVGCDVEAIKDYDEELAKTCLCDNELNILKSSINLNDKKSLFYKYWTLKESIMKCSSLGLNLEPKSIYVFKQNNNYLYELVKGNSNVVSKNYNLYDLDIDGIFSWSVCDSGKRKDILIREIHL